MDTDYVFPNTVRTFYQPYSGFYVDYEEFRKCEYWADHLDGKKIKIAEPVNLFETEDDKIAFFINLYNFLCVYAVSLEETLPKRVRDTDIFDEELCVFAGHSLTLNEIIHGILRGNRPNPFTKERVLKEGSPKLALVLNKYDPRILFVLTSLDLSGSPLPTRMLFGGSLELVLKEAVTNHLKRTIRLRRSTEMSVILPQMMQWYQEDFIGDLNNLELITWIIRLTEEPYAQQLTSFIETTKMMKVDLSIVFDDHNWDLNNVPEKVKLIPPSSCDI